ncbi:PREDICTED: CASP-like protein Os02g0134500, partial [Nipponia nippon]|uniref:CASP-like protein Os02g0134500 n=1 Tax=Nipponia nippon TaxID=128390 RepID=UPI0005116F2B
MMLTRAPNPPRAPEAKLSQPGAPGFASTAAGRPVSGQELWHEPSVRDRGEDTPGKLRRGLRQAAGSPGRTGTLPKLPRCNREALQVLFVSKGEREKGQPPAPAPAPPAPPPAPAP